jgi:hypothetical protein
MRESGFDVSFLFGPFSAETRHYAPAIGHSQRNGRELFFRLARPVRVDALVYFDSGNAQCWKR